MNVMKPMQYRIHNEVYYVIAIGGYVALCSCCTVSWLDIIMTPAAGATSAGECVLEEW